jgi:protein phosphatase
MDPDDPSIRERGLLMLVADGLGGHSSGNVASRMVSEELPRIYIHSERPDIITSRAEAVSTVNDLIYQKSQASPTLRGMASTLAACVIIGDYLVALNVGDSRIYLLNGNNFLQVSEDHLRITTSMTTGRKKDLLTRALGAQRQHTQNRGGRYNTSLF